MSGNLITTLRQNHALEHATMAILIRKVGLNVRVVGSATIDGFYVYGDISTEAIREAATEGLARLQRGEQELAVSPFCGTNITVAGPRAILVATWAIIAAQPIGRIVQKYLTTSPILSDVTIKRITRRGIGNRILHKIETARD